MLKILRHKKLAKKIWITLAVLVLPAFILWGSGSMIRSKEDSEVIGKISGKTISIADYKDSLQAVRNQALIQFGDKFSEIQAALDLNAQAWERLILLSEARHRNIKVSDKELVEFIQGYPFFQGKNGFDKSIYNQMLQYVFHTQPRVFEEGTRQNMMIGKLFDLITNKVELKDTDTKEEYRKANEEISVNYISSNPQDIAKSINVDEQEVKDYFSKNPLAFKQPLSFNIEYAQLSSEEKDASQKVNLIYRALAKKEDFAKVLKEKKLDIKESGLFTESGPIPGIGWSEQLIALINRAKPGSYINPLLIDKTYYIIRLKEKKEPYVPGYDSIKNKVKEEFLKEKALTQAKEKITQCLGEIKKLNSENKNADLSKLATQFGLKFSTTQNFKFSGYIDGVGQSDKFWETANNLKNEEISPAIEMPSGFYIIKVKSKTPIDEKKFEQEKTEFVKKLLSQKKQELFLEFTAELKKKSQRFN